MDQPTLRFGLQRLCAWGACALPLVGIVGAFLFSLRQLFDVVGRLEDPEIDSTLMFLRLLDVIVALSSLLGFPILWMIGRYNILAHLGCLTNGYEWKETLVHKCIVASRIRLSMHLFLWLAAVLVRTLAEFDVYQLSWPVPEVSTGSAALVRVLAFALSSAALAAVMCLLDLTCCVMVTSVNAFCFRCVETDLEVDSLVEDWNILQALLRRSTANCDVCIILLVAAVSSAVVTALVVPLQAALPDIRTFWVLAIVSPLSMIFGKVFMSAAEVTEKSRRVPALVNSMTFRFEREERFYMTHNLSQSSAGFYIGESAVSGTMVLKLGHLTFLALFTVLSRLISKG